MRSRAWWGSSLVGEAARFSVVGALSYVLDVGVFNALRVLPAGILSEPLVAKTTGMVVATLFAWVGSRYWTFRRGRRQDRTRELVEFTLVGALGYAVTLAVLFVSHYVLGLTTLLADNIAANLVGAVLGTVVRFTLYRSWVYRPDRATPRGPTPTPITR